jgi:recombinational DNA repair protein RecR
MSNKYIMFVDGGEHESTAYHVLETATNTVIEVGTNKEQIENLLRRLNNGGGFNGWTPSFIAPASRCEII